IISKIGVSGATGHVIEYAGKAFRSMSIEQRLTVCNMSIEAGARAGLVAPDETTFAYVKGKPFAPSGADFDQAVEYWRGLKTDEGAVFDKEVVLDARDIQPMVTWGTTPGMAIPVGKPVPSFSDASSEDERKQWESALEYMGL